MSPININSRFTSSSTAYGTILNSVVGKQVAIGSTQSWNIYLSGSADMQGMCKISQNLFFRRHFVTISIIKLQKKKM